MRISHFHSDYFSFGYYFGYFGLLLLLLPTPLSWAFLMECAGNDAVVAMINVSLSVGKCAVESALLLYLSLGMHSFVCSATCDFYMRSLRSGRSPGWVMLWLHPELFRR
jgi:hypothetical protein